MGIRILHVTESLAAGGIETTFLHMLQAFRTIDPTIAHEVLAFASGPLEAAYREVCRTVRVVPEWQAAAACLAAGPDLVHVLFERCAYRLMPALLAGTSAPVVYGKGYDMGGMYRANEGLRWQADESMLVACSATTFTTEALARVFDVPGHVTVLGKAADVRRFSDLPTPSPTGPSRILCVANLHPRKRVGDLIEALPEVRRRAVDAELRLVGSGTEEARQALIDRAQRAGVADAVSFAGHVADVAPEVAAARLMALPSSCEGVPTVLLEGMAAGRPVVATRTGHVESIVTDGVEGRLVDVGDVSALADCLAEILTDDSLARRMSVAARARASRHDVAATAARLLDVLVAAIPRASLASASQTS
ncbi:MAG TPA: glycosyltransferase family 4 protein [Vicinamibacterales bacterium]